MGKLVISENVSLDGVIEDPIGTGSLGRGNWFDFISDCDREEWTKLELAEALGAEALLMGRRSYEWFIARGWVTRDGEWADRLRSLPKYVVSSSALEDPSWKNAMVLSGEVVEQVSQLKRRVDGDVVIYGSGRLVHTLLEHDLVDELRLITYPVVVGAGQRLFAETNALRPLRLDAVRTVGDGLALLTYRRRRDA